MNVESILNTLPEGLRTPLINEYNSILQNFLERRWTPAELSGGKFCEIVYTILKGYGISNYDQTPSKPRNFVDACRKLENNSDVPRSFQILIPRMLPALYEIRNNRNVGHVGGDVNPNVMDSTAVVQITGWIMGELIRVFHNLSIEDAENAVTFITERKIPIVWQTSEGVKRVLKPKISIPNQLLILIGTTVGKEDVDKIFVWLDYSNTNYSKRLLKKFHRERLLEYDEINNTVELLPPGALKVEKLIEAYV